MKALEAKETKWEETEKQMQAHADTAAQKVVLDIGMLRVCLVYINNRIDRRKEICGFKSCATFCRGNLFPCNAIKWKVVAR